MIVIVDNALLSAAAISDSYKTDKQEQTRKYIPARLCFSWRSWRILTAFGQLIGDWNHGMSHTRESILTYYKSRIKIVSSNLFSVLWSLNFILMDRTNYIFMLSTYRVKFTIFLVIRSLPSVGGYHPTKPLRRFQ